MPIRWTSAALAGAAVVLAVATVQAAAETATRSDAKGRTITFDLQAAGVDVDGYARILSEALHGDEISAVTVRVVPPAAIAGACGSDAVACWQRDSAGSRIIVPARTATAVREALVHEYGHHLDSSVRHQPGRCADGTPRWWTARGAAGLLASGDLRCDYSAGWGRSLAEVFAEDYKVLNVPGSSSGGGAGPPSAAVLDALRQDLLGLDSGTPPPPGGGPPGSPPGAPPGPTTGGPGGLAAPVLGRGGRLVRAARLAPGEAFTIRFRLTRRQGVVLSLRRTALARGDFVVVMRCGRGPKLVGDGRNSSRVEVSGRLGPGSCTAKIRAGRRPVGFSVKLSIPR